MVENGLSAFPFIKPERLERAAILSHRHADVDAYASSYGVASILKQMNRRVDVQVSAPQGFSSLAKSVQAKYPVRVVDEPILDDVDLIVVLDTGHALLIEEWLERIRSSKSVRVFVDHHPKNESMSGIVNHMVVDEEASSTSEIVYDIFREKGLRLTKMVAQVLLLGILTDSQHLAIAECRTIRAVSALCSKGASLADARRLLQSRRDFSERVARLKAAQRVKLYRAEDWLLAVTKVGSFQSSAAKALLDLGADASLALGESEGGVQGSLRATREFCDRAKIHLGVDVAGKVAAKIRGMGGGHRGAASLSGRVGTDEAVALVLGEFSRKLDADLHELN